MKYAPGRRRQRILRIFKWTVTLAIGLWLVGCRAAALVSPEQEPLLAFLPFTTAAAIIANGLVFVFLLFRKRLLRSAVPLIALIAAADTIKPVFGAPLHQSAQSLVTRPQFKVLLWNVHGLGIYDLPEDKAIPQKMLQFIREQDADVVFLVEFYTDYQDAMKPHSARFLNEGGFREFRFVWDNTLGTKIYIGIGMFSKLPVSAIEERWIANNISLLQSDVSVDSATRIRFLTMHLESFRLADKDKTVIDEAKGGRAGVKGSLQLLKKYMQQSIRPFQNRARQADSVAGIIAESPYPVIVCGDLNDIPGSYSYTTVRGEMGDAFADYGKPFGRTYNRLSPTLRIDHIFYDPDAFRCVDFKTFQTSMSDHNPILATFELKTSR